MCSSAWCEVLEQQNHCGEGMMAQCECGCGKEAGLVRRTRPHLGLIKGNPNRFLLGHSRRGKRWPIVATVKMYRTARKANGLETTLHRLRAENALGHALPAGAVVHHADGSRRDDAPLVICQDTAYHKLLHARMRVIAAGGNPNTDAVCGICRLAKARSEFRPRASGVFGVRDSCQSCVSARQQEGAARG